MSEQQRAVNERTWTGLVTVTPSVAGEALDTIARRHGTDKSTMGHAYTPTYEWLLEGRRSEELLVLELGVLTGASIRMWADYFTRGLIVGVDLAPPAGDFGPRVCMVRGDASSEITIAALLDGVARWLPTFGKPIAFDLIVDDASHLTADQIRSFELLWPHLAPGGFYVIEDICCAYWGEYSRGVPFGAWIRERFDDVQQRGKRAHGEARRFDRVLAHNALTPYERTIEYMVIAAGLVVFHKRG